jgi:predicted ATPase/DNA-binding XRE family transcriptional regulator
MADTLSFGQWLHQRRRERDLTQVELGSLVGCAQVTIRKIEADRLRPSRQLAELLVEKLGVPSEKRDVYIHFARSGIFPGSVLLAPSHHNLPQPLTSFIGRQVEAEEVKRLLATSRLLTLTGAGGVGKSRLALQVAASVQEKYQDGIWFVELAAIVDPEVVPLTLASTLGLQKAGEESYQSQLIRFLREKNALLILDNCEQIIEACARLAYTLLQQCPKISILTTCRETLDVEGEVVYRLPSLTNLDPVRVSEFHQLEETDSVRLFMERAQAILSDFKLTSQNLSAVARVCYRLDGIPLAIELAAARISALSVEQIADRLDDRFRLLIIGNRTALPRHRTLRSLIDWSYDLLPEEERLLLQRLSVFAGGWTLDAAEGVCAGQGLEQGQVLDALSSLVKKSLVLATNPADGGNRYRMLETIRQYGEEKLGEAKARNAIHTQHRDWYLALAEKADIELKGHAQLAWLKRLEVEHDNLRAALEWSFVQEDGQAALRLVAALGYYWAMRNFNDESSQYRQKSLDLAIKSPALGRSRLRAQVLQGPVLTFKNYWPASPNPKIEDVQEALGIFQELGDQAGIAHAMLIFSSLILRTGDNTTAGPLAEDSLAIMQDEKDAWGIANCLFQLKLVAEANNEWHRLPVLGNEAVSILRSAGDRWCLSYLLSDQIWGVWDAGDTERARQLFEENWQIHRDLNDFTGQVRLLRFLSFLARLRGDYASASRYLKNALQFKREVAEITFLGIQCELGQLALDQGYLDEAGAYFQDGYQISEALHDLRFQIDFMNGLGRIQYYRGANHQAKVLLEQALSILEHASFLLTAYMQRWLLSDLGDVACAQGDFTVAVNWHRKSLALIQSMGSRPYAPKPLEGLAKAIGKQGHTQQAIRLLAAAQTAREWMEIPRAPMDQPDYDRFVEAFKMEMGEDAFQGAWKEGSTMTIDQAMVYALAADNAMPVHS